MIEKEEEIEIRREKMKDRLSVSGNEQQDKLKSLQQIQREVAEWSQYNFGDQTSKVDSSLKLGSLAPLMGLTEELGELYHATLKRHQGIRGFEDRKKYEAERDDAVADILVYLCDYASREGIDLLGVLNETWSKVVAKRDWTEERGDND